VYVPVFVKKLKRLTRGSSYRLALRWKIKQIWNFVPNFFFKKIEIFNNRIQKGTVFLWSQRWYFIINPASFAENGFIFIFNVKKIILLAQFSEKCRKTISIKQSRRAPRFSRKRRYTTSQKRLEYFRLSTEDEIYCGKESSRE